MSNWRRILPFLGVLAVVAYTIWFVADKERIISRGELALFELAPVDPRSLLQGDYMQLRYRIDDDLVRSEIPPLGYLVFTTDDANVARFQRIQPNVSPLAERERIIQFRRRRAGRMRSGIVKLAADSYFFQEGTAERFARARYGGLMIDEFGEAVLVGLWDEDRQPIAPALTGQSLDSGQ
ncbi:GDYXXLXY domain-containing protein [Lewinella sp. IMCC34191]|uniref:GDYXXLXY domain-containing protein n=1 Tax=Lewinella sp. IMCC34191 TaxID=2259172 RepID=UPI0013005DAF|nr:GDYXXLXY domain-containing protein [Lewinella sp. IMCC34191]